MAPTTPLLPPKRNSVKAKGCFRRSVKVRVVYALILLDQAGEDLVLAVPHEHPLERGNDIACSDVGVVVELKAAAQRERIEQPVIGSLPGIDHLRPNVHLIIPAKQLVVDHGAVHRDVVHLGEHRIERLRLCLRHDAKDFLDRLGGGAATARVDQCGGCSPGGENTSAKHTFRPCLSAADRLRRTTPATCPAKKIVAGDFLYTESTVQVEALHVAPSDGSVSSCAKRCV